MADAAKHALKPFVPSVVRRRMWRAPGSAESGSEWEADGFPNWAHWIAQDRRLWKAARRRARLGPEVLLGTSMGGFTPATVMESLLGVALTLRGARVRYLLCDGALPACLQTHVMDPDPGVLARYELGEVLCGACYPPGAAFYASHGLPVVRYGEFVSDEDRSEARRQSNEVAYDEIATYRWRDLAVGEHALAGTLRFYARGQLKGAEGGETTLRRFLEASLLTAMTMQNLLGGVGIDRACFHHGIYVPQGLIAETCRQDGVPLVTWNVAYRQGCFLFSHGDTYHHTMLDEPTETWEGMSWGPAQDNEIMEYLASRLTGTRDWLWFHERPIEDVDHIARELGINRDRPIIGLLTNVFWDAQLHYRANAFPDMLDWLLRSIDYFGRRPELQLLIRIHPAEVRGTIPSRQPLLDEIGKAFPAVPPNVFVIPPESNSSTYAAMEMCDAVLIYGTKTGVELSSRGIPVIVAGEAWVRGKGITQDANSPEEYFRLLDALPLGRRLDDATMRRARMYAYHFFLRRMIPLPFIHPAGGKSVPYTVEIQGLRDLLPGMHPGLDVICDGIVTGTPFVYPAERFTA